MLKKTRTPSHQKHKHWHMRNAQKEKATSTIGHGQAMYRLRTWSSDTVQVTFVTPMGTALYKKNNSLASRAINGIAESSTWRIAIEMF